MPSSSREFKGRQTHERARGGLGAVAGAGRTDIRSDEPHGGGKALDQRHDETRGRVRLMTRETHAPIAATNSQRLERRAIAGNESVAHPPLKAEL